jgi:hypothetical protein
MARPGKRPKRKPLDSSPWQRYDYCCAVMQQYSSRPKEGPTVMKVYTPAQVAEILQIDEEEVMQLVHRGDLPAFSVLGQPRMKEEALLDLTNRPYSETPNMAARERFLHRGNAKEGRRKRDPQLATRARQWVWEQLRRVAPDLSVHSITRFTANGKQGVLAMSTTTSGPKKQYWLGFHEGGLDTRLPWFIVPVLADREIAFVIPYARHRAAFDGLSRDQRGQKKFNIVEISGEHYLTGKGLQKPLLLTPYLNAFNSLR